jgi:hypothetical protein
MTTLPAGRPAPDRSAGAPRARTRMGRGLVAVAFATAAVAATLAPGGGAANAASGVRLNQMQVIGTHNSYHVEPSAEAIAAYQAFVPDAITLAYSHPPLAQQFDDEGVRQIELDVYADPAGTLWRPIGTPGFKVFHIEIIDEDATCTVFVDCLRQVKAWSDAHPTHMPLGIQVELKDSDDLPFGNVPVAIDSAQLDALDAEIRSVFPPDRLITPDDVRGSRATLEEAVLNDGWPKIDDVRGRMIFVLDNKHDEYVAGHPSLEGRVAFAPSEPGLPDAAFIKYNDPLGGGEAQIRSLVEAGYLVRTRADEPVTTAQSGDTTQRDAALRSGAQWVSTDYPIPGYSTRWQTDYVAQIPGGTPARCNPVNAPPGCQSSDIEQLAQTPSSSSTTTPPVSSTTRRSTGAAAAVTVQPRFTG